MRNRALICSAHIPELDDLPPLPESPVLSPEAIPLEVNTDGSGGGHLTSRLTGHAVGGQDDPVRSVLDVSVCGEVEGEWPRGGRLETTFFVGVARSAAAAEEERWWSFRPRLASTSMASWSLRGEARCLEGANVALGLG